MMLYTTYVYQKICLQSAEQAYKSKYSAKFHKNRIGIAISKTIKPQIGLYVYMEDISKSDPICTKFGRQDF